MSIRPNDDFYLDVDSSSIGYGWRFYQKDPCSGLLRPVAYGSAAANDYQKKYSSAAAELQGVYLAVRVHNATLFVRQKIICTDRFGHCTILEQFALTNKSRKTYRCMATCT